MKNNHIILYNTRFCNCSKTEILSFKNYVSSISRICCGCKLFLVLFEEAQVAMTLHVFAIKYFCAAKRSENMNCFFFDEWVISNVFGFC